MRVLFSTVSPAGYMAPPLLGDEQVNCGPDWPDAKDSSGRFLSLHTPAGEYDLAAIAAKLPPEQQPDLVVCLVDATWRNLPRRLAAFKCPRVLLVADTHHLNSPLTIMMRYLGTETFDRIVLLYDRHHAGFFRSAGFRNLYWFPGLTFPHRDGAVRTARKEGARANQIAFAGQAGKHHPRRERLIGALTASGLPLASRPLPQAQALNLYGASMLGFNASLNGDLNLRVFEILASGAALLTDRLSSESGLARLLSDGREMLAYGSPGELTERAAHALARPAETMAIGAAGGRWFDAHLGGERRAAAFRNLAFGGAPVPEFDFSPEEKTRVFFGGAADRLQQGIIVYEGVQESHREQETVRVALDPAAPTEMEAIFATLPRAIVRRGGADLESDLAVIGRASQTPPAARRLWCWDAEKDDGERLRALFAPQGFVLNSKRAALFSRAAEARADSAEAAFARGAHAEAQALAHRTLAANPSDVAALSVVARLALKCGNRKFSIDVIRLLCEIDPANPLVLAAKAAGKALTLTPGELATWREIAHGFAAGKNYQKASEIYAVICQMSPEDPTAWHDHGQALYRAKRAGEAMASSLHAAELAPADCRIQLQAGQAALAAKHWEAAEAAFERVKSIEPTKISADQGLARVEWARTAESPPADGYDLIICHLEITRLHGTGILLQRFFPDAGPNLITLRANSLYEGKMEIGGRHWVIEGFGLSIAQREARLRKLLAPYKIRRILCTPYYPADFLHGYLAKKITGAPLCCYVMDDQALYGGNAVPSEVARWLFERADLRLAISPEMSRAYLRNFGVKFSVLPPILTSVAGRAPNHWRPGAEPARCALVGNIWSERQFEQLRQLARAAALAIDWFGNANVAWLPRDRGELERDGIYCRGFLPELKLAERVAEYPFVIVPSGQLDGTEDNEWLTRLSLPSRMAFILAQTFTPMLVLGSPETAAAGFVRRLGVGLSASYDPDQAGAAIRQLLDPERRAQMISNARRLADAFVMPDAGEWIWRSLAAGAPEPTELASLMERDGSEAAIPEPAAAIA